LQATQKSNSEGCPSNQVSAVAMTSASDEKWRAFNCFFQSGRAKDFQHSCNSCSLTKKQLVHAELGHCGFV